MPATTQDPLRIDLLEASFALLAPRAPELVERFYTRLFEVAPAARGLFPDDLQGQRRALLGSLGMIVNSLRAPAALGSYLSGLGERHVGYGALPPHYDVVGAVLLETMAEMAGDAWTTEIENAWTNAYAAIKSIMLSAAEAQTAAA